MDLELAVALPQGPSTDLCDSRVTVSPEPVLLLLAEAEAETLQPPIRLFVTSASVVAEALLPSADMAGSSAELGKAGHRTSPRNKAATGAECHNQQEVAAVVPPKRNFFLQLLSIVPTPT